MASCRVIGLSGHSLEFQLPKESKVSDLKRLVEDAWGVPRICQRLLCAGQILGDSFRCEALPGKELQLVVSTETLHATLQSALAKEALGQLQKCAAHCDPGNGVWPALEAEAWDCLQHSPETDNLVDSAAEVLIAAALARRPKTLEGALAHLEGSCSRARLASAKMLIALGDAEHFGHLRGRLEDPCPLVRTEVVKGLARLAPLDKGLLFAITGHLHDTNVMVRQASVESIGLFASTSGCPACSNADSGECKSFLDNLEFACMAILSRLQHPQVSVRSFVAAAMARTVACTGGDFCEGCGKPRCQTAKKEQTWAAEIAQLLRACLLDTAAPVQGVALQAIAELSGEHGKLRSPELLALRAQVFACLSHSDAGVRITASRAITKLVPFGDQEVASTLRKMSKLDADISVRTAAKNALPFMGEDPF